jgi:6-pyruvoyltetrahydropterin/6-carboxytetrahydropterin synthase
MIYLTRKEVFSASHKLYNPQLSEEQNYAIYDKCANKHGHGHNYTVEVTIAGKIDPNTGYLFDLKLLKQIIRDEIISKVDHKHLNYDVDFLTGVIPTAENLVVAFWNQLKDRIPVGILHSVKLHETENNMVEYRGD